MSLLEQKNEITKLVMTMPNANLREVCRKEGLAVSGVKSTLQRRITSRLEEYVQTGDVNAIDRLQFRTKNPLAQYQNLPEPSAAASSAVAAGSSSSSSRPHPPHSTSSYGHSVTNGYPSSSMGRSKHSNRNPSNALSAPIKFHASPFYTQDQVLATVNILVCQHHRNVAKAQITFNSQQSDRLRQNSSQRVLIYCSEAVGASTQQLSNIAFPGNIEIRTNGTEVKANTRGIKKKAGTTKPVDITSFLRKQPGIANNVEITYALTEKAYIVVIYLATKRSVDELRANLEQGRVISKDRVLSEMRARADDPDIVAVSTNMSLKDPVSYTRITLPCRGESCRHFQCFDATSFLQLQEQAETWECPLCNRSITFGTIAVDQYFQDILERTPSSADQVTIEPNGTWHVGSVITNGAGGPTPEEDNDDDYDDDDIVEIIDFRSKAIQAEAPTTPASMAQHTPPVAFGSTSAGVSLTPNSGSAPRGQKRSSIVIDLTLSDGESGPPPTKRPANKSTVKMPSRGASSTSLPRPPGRYSLTIPDPPSFSPASSSTPTMNADRSRLQLNNNNVLSTAASVSASNLPQPPSQMPQNAHGFYNPYQSPSPFQASVSPPAAAASPPFGMPAYPPHLMSLEAQSRPVFGQPGLPGAGSWNRR